VAITAGCHAVTFPQAILIGAVGGSLTIFVQALLDKLSGNRIQEFLSAVPPGEKDGIQISLGDSKDEKKRKLAFWKVKKDKTELLYARDLLSKQSEALRVDGAVAAALPWSRDHFIKKEKK
jgi:hypothetical protein